MKYKEIKLFAKDSAQLAMLTEELTAAGFDELLINDPKDVDELQEGSWAYTGSIADKELLDSFMSSFLRRFRIWQGDTNAARP